MRLAFSVKDEIKEALEAYAHLPGMVRIAVRQALSDTAKSMRKDLLRETAKAARIPQKVIRQRFRDHLSRSIDKASVWIGTFPVSLSALGHPVQTRTGVKVGRLPEFTGAFVGRGKLSGRGIFIRYNSPHFDPERYRTPKKKGPNTITRALGLPISEWVEDEGGGYEPILNRRMMENLRKRMDYAAKKAARGEFLDRVRNTP